MCNMMTMCINCATHFKILCIYSLYESWLRASLRTLENVNVNVNVRVNVLWHTMFKSIAQTPHWLEVYSKDTHCLRHTILKCIAKTYTVCHGDTRSSRVLHRKTSMSMSMAMSCLVLKCIAQASPECLCRGTGIPLTEEIRIKILGSPDLSVFLIDHSKFEWQGLCLLRWNLVWNFGLKNLF